MDIQKKFLLIFVIATMLLLAGCTSPPVSGTKTEKTAPEVKKEEPKMEEKTPEETVNEKPTEVMVEEDNYNDNLDEALTDLDVVGDLNLLEAIEE